ncbi:MAG: glycosyltransferase family 4 protein [Deltaproteobacteria bacterium]|nr:glycosyltransferase family 4 protein [Deltaproteobacteria bacterium]
MEHRPRKIAMIINDFYPKSGGISTWNQNIAKFLHKKNLQIHIYLLTAFKKINYEEKFPFTITAIHEISIYPKVFGSPGVKNISRYIVSVLKFLSLINENFKNYDIIQSSDPVCGILGSIIKILYRKPHIIIIGENSYFNFNYNFLKMILYSIAYFIIFRFADSIIVDGEDIRNALVRRKIRISKIKLIPHAIDINQFAPIKNKSNLKKYFGLEDQKIFDIHKTVIVFLGRLYDLNDPISFLRILNNIPNCIGIVIGDGPLRPIMEKKAKTIKTKIIFTGMIELDEVPYALAVADICVFPLKSIGGVSQVVTEAMACGKCVVTTNAGSMGDLITDGYNGFISDVGDIEKITRNTLTASKNREMRRKMGENARKTVIRNWSWEKRIHVYLELYSDPYLS